ncbi:MAG TPA: threonine/serine dehydratase [Caulobacteraceae bacterium]|jgi:threonine dehydratase
MSALIALAEIEAARARIAPYVSPTPVLAMNPTGLKLKAENLTPIGAFKIRGAFNAMLGLDEAQKAAGVVAHSSGNHAQAVAYVAARLGIKATVVMPANAPAPKLAGVRREGAEIVLVGPAAAERSAKARELADARGLTPIEPFDMEAIMCGTGTVGLEILEQAPEVETIFVPVSGGGLLAGVAAAVKLSRPSVRVIGVEPALANDAAQSFKAGEIVTITAEETLRTLADGLRVQRLGAKTWPHIRAYVDDIITVSEAQITAAMRRIAAETRLIAEPSGAAAPAGALAYGGDPRLGVAVVSGGNIDPKLFAEILMAE